MEEVIEKKVEEREYSLLGIKMSLEDFDRLLCEQSQGKELSVVDGRVMAEYPILTEEAFKDIQRAKRTPLLNAFDKWEKAVLRGREQDDYVIMSWYHDLLNLTETAFENIPLRIKYYL